MRNCLSTAAKIPLCWLSRQLCIKLLLLTFSLCLPLIPGQSIAAEQEAIRIGITPCTDILKTFKIFQPLSLYLQDKLNRPVQLIIPKDFYEFETLAKNNKIDFAYQAPHTYIRLAKLYNKNNLLKSLTPKGDTTHHGVVIVRKDSAIKTLADLKGKVIMFGSKLSTAKSMATKELLKNNNIDINKDLKNYIYGGSCESIALNIFLKSVDAGAICDYSFEEINDPEDTTEAEIPANQMRIIAETIEIPTWIFTALQKTDSQVVTEVFNALGELNGENEQQEHILEAAEIGGFVPANDSDYEQIRQMAETFQ